MIWQNSRHGDVDCASLHRRRRRKLIAYRSVHRIVALAAALMGVLAAAPTLSARVTWGEPVQVASGEAYVGPWRMNASQFHYVDDPTVAIDEGGAVGIAWVDQTQRDIYFQSYAPDGTKRFAQPVNVSRTPTVFSWLPRMVIAGNDPSSVYILWQEIIFSGGSHGGEILFARSNDGGKTFGRPLNLSNSTAGDGKGRLTQRYWHNGSLDLAMSTTGTLYAAWTEYEGVLWFSRSMDGGNGFSKPIRVAGGAGTLPARGPSLGIATDNIVYLAWTVGEDPSADIRIAKSNDAGRSFDTSRVVFDSKGHCDAPQIAVDSNGVLHLVYAESPSGPLQRYQIRYTRSNDGAQTFEKPRAISVPLHQNHASSNFPALSIDGEDNLYVLWELFAERERRPRGLGFTVSGDGGRTFAPPSVIPGSAETSLGHNGGRQGLLMRKLAVSRAGAIAVTNSTFKRGEASHVWLLRGHQTGP